MQGRGHTNRGDQRVKLSSASTFSFLPSAPSPHSNHVTSSALHQKHLSSARWTMAVWRHFNNCNYFSGIKGPTATVVTFYNVHRVVSGLGRPLRQEKALPLRQISEPVNKFARSQLQYYYTNSSKKELTWRLSPRVLPRILKSHLPCKMLLNFAGNKTDIQPTFS